KVVLSLQHGEIPPCVHFKAINPEIRLEGSSFRIPVERQPWPPGTRIAGVSSFGFGGTNAHVVVKQGIPRPAAPGARDRPVHLLALSARTDEALRRLATRYHAWLTSR